MKSYDVIGCDVWWTLDAFSLANNLSHAQDVVCVNVRFVYSLCVCVLNFDCPRKKHAIILNLHEPIINLFCLDY